jgi:hypothetical protein
MRYIRLPRQSVALAIVPVVIAYCALTGFYPASVRATVRGYYRFTRQTPSPPGKTGWSDNSGRLTGRD